MSDRYIMAVDQGTTSTRAMIFDTQARVASVDQVEHRQILPRAGWVEHDPLEIWRNTRQVIGGALKRAGVGADQIAALGITNQRETTVVWDRHDGQPIHNALVWQDTRTQAVVDELAASGGTDRYRSTCGLPLATYFSAPKIAWLLDNVPGARERAEAGDLLFGTTDAWLLWNLTGGSRGDAVHATDVTNASRTMLMDLTTLRWDEQIAADLRIPLSMLPQIHPSSGVAGTCVDELLAGVPIGGILGDQQAAMFGQACLAPGSVKNTYGTGNFVLLNTGTHIVFSKAGLLTTLCYQLAGQQPVYALEGSIAVTGSLVQWLRDNVGLVESASAIEALAAAVPDNGGVYIVPAFSGLFAPHWRPDARGAILGLTRYVNKSHLARAALESVAYQTRDVLDAMQADVRRQGGAIAELRVDGGMVANELLMQFQADLLDIPVVRPRINETTALGAAYAAGLAVGYWESADQIVANWGEKQRWRPSMPPEQRERLYRNWQKAVRRTLDWVDQDVP